MQNDKSTLSTRKILCHDVPAWVTDQSVFFVTIRSEKMNPILLIQQETALFIRDSFFYRQKLGQWQIHFCC